MHNDTVSGHQAASSGGVALGNGDTLSDEEIALVLRAQRHISDTQSNLMDGLRDRMQTVEAVFTHSTEPRTLTHAEDIARLHHHINMLEGENIALWRALEKLEGTLATINHLIVPERRHIASGRQRTSNGDGSSPIQGNPG